MKIGIITFHAAHNYGSMLQAYALQTFLERNGNIVEIINFRPKSQRKGYPLPVCFNSKHNAKLSLLRLLFAPTTIKPLKQKWELFETFLNQHLHVTEEFHTLEELQKAHFDYDVLITGSDQIWNTKAFDFSEAYFGTFISSNKTRKMAYAPSMGPEPEKQNVDYVKHLLTDFKGVSVREERTKRFLVDNGICKDVELVVDPTMLLEVKDYDSLYDQSPIIKEKYVFYYTPGSVRHEFLSEASKIGKQLGLPVICDTCYAPGDLKRYDNVRSFTTTGPSEFLNLVKNASFVCGASFHLMVFAILFQKDFCCMNGDVDSRMNNLMKMTGMEDKIWKSDFENINRYHFSKIKNDNSAIDESANYIKGIIDSL